MLGDNKSHCPNGRWDFSCLQESNNNIAVCHPEAMPKDLKGKGAAEVECDADLGGEILRCAQNDRGRAAVGAENDTKNGSEFGENTELHGSY